MPSAHGRGLFLIRIASCAKNRYSPSMDITLHPSLVGGKITIPSSKSQTIRALLLATFSKGISIIRNPLDSQDTRSCIQACEAFGAIISPVPKENHDSVEVLRVEGFGIPSKPVTIDCGNSGTTLYLAAGMAASSTHKITFTGDDQLKRRPIGNLLKSLEDLGAQVEKLPDGSLPQYPPFTVSGPLTGGRTSIECHTSQHLSALLLGAPLASGDSEIIVPLLNEKPYVHITLSWLNAQQIKYSHNDELSYFHILGNQCFTPFEATVNGDFSSASFFFCAAAITGEAITVEGLDPEDPQGDKQILLILETMGCTISWKGNSVTIQGPNRGNLKGGDFDLNAIPDALPILAVTACFAQGTTKLGNVPQARIKETDRIAVMYQNLSILGAKVQELEDALIINGRGSLHGGICDGYGDHRIIMAMAIASLGCDGPLTIKGTEAVDVTFPTFFQLFNSIRK
jgi:3-phosphoshikimate 1-carboxyvinyltransferase